MASQKQEFLYFRDMVIRLGTYSIIPIGLNYSINLYSRAAESIINRWMGTEINWVEYLLPVINLIIIFLAIFIVLRLGKKNRKWLILTGRY